MIQSTTRPITRQRPIPSQEQGYILVWVMFLLAVFTIWLSVAVPRAAKEIQRDREVETMERGKQYIRAVQLYYRRFHAYPPNKDALVNTNQIRFLRKKYVDPMTGKDDWKPILFGQAKTQTLGFFGQPLAGTGSAGGSMMAGIGPSGNNGAAQNNGLGLNGSGSSIGSPSPSIFSSSDSSGGSNGVPSSGSAGASGTSATSNSSSSNSSSFGSNPSGQTFGGAGIIGFSPASSRQSILVYKKKNHYNEWEFVYDPLSEMRNISGNTGGIGQPASSTTSPIGTSPFGSNPTGTPANTPSSTPSSGSPQ